MLGIICAMEIEMAGIRAAMTDTEEKEISGIRFVKGKLKECDAVAAVCGIGSVFAAMCAQTMILEYKPDYIINVGVGGALSTKLDIGNIVVAESLVQHDMDTSAIGDPVGLISGINIVYLPTDKELTDRIEKAAEVTGHTCFRGTIASGNKFVSKAEDKKRIVELFDAMATEMEGAPIAQVCYVNKIKCAVIRSISDRADESATMDYEQFKAIAAKNSVDVICKIAETRM